MIEQSKKDLRYEIDSQRRLLNGIEEALVYENGSIKHALECITELLFESYQRAEFFKVIKVRAEEMGWKHLESASNGLRFTFEEVGEEE